MVPDNGSYMYAAYAVTLAVYALYWLSIWRRRRRVQAELRLRERAGVAS